MMPNKKGIGLQDLLPYALLLVVSILAITIGSQILHDVKESQCAYGHISAEGICLNSTGGTSGTLGSTVASNTTGEGQQGLNEFGSWFPTIALVLAAALVVGILITSFGRN